MQGLAGGISTVGSTQSAWPCCHCRQPFTQPPPAGASGARATLRAARRAVVVCAADSKVDEASPGPSTDGSTPPTPGQPLASVEKGVRLACDCLPAIRMPPYAGSESFLQPPLPGSTLYTVFEVQAWISLAVGGLLSFNLLLPTDQPSIARMLGMWSIWMFTVPSLRARDCDAAEKDALNLLFLAIPLLNITLPFLWRSFAFVYSADVVALAAVFAWKGVLPGGAKEQ